MGPETEMEGNLELMRKYGRFFFIGSEKNESDPGDAPWNGIPCGGHRFSAEIMTRDMFQEIVALKPGKARLHGDLDPSVMAGGEKRCLRYAETFAIWHARRGAAQRDRGHRAADRKVVWKNRQSINCGATGNWPRC
jgi:hypothetical protein